tara:strand:- start:2364 stop:2669 length:306 start_codon:yes stop_codon:yes gene_type:complete
MKNIIYTIIIIFISSTLAYADYSKNPHCRGYGILEHEERQKCLKANQGLVKKERTKILNESGQLDTSAVKKTGKKIMKGFEKIGLNTDSKLFKTGKYKEKK